MQHQVFFLTNDARLVTSRTVIEKVIVGATPVFLFSDGTFCPADICFNTENQCRRHYGLPEVEVEVQIVLFLTIERVPEVKYNFLTNFSKKHQPVYEEAIRSYKALYGKDIFQIRSAARPMKSPDGSLWVDDTITNLSDFWKLFWQIDKSPRFKNISITRKYSHL